MATFQQIAEGGRPLDSPNGKHITRKLCSNASISTWHTNPQTTTKRSYLGSTSDMGTCSRPYGKSRTEYNNNSNGYFEVQTMLVPDMNRNVQETSKRSNVAAIEKNISLKQTLPTLLCIKKTQSSSSSALRTLNVNALKVNDDVNSNDGYYSTNAPSSKMSDGRSLDHDDVAASSSNVNSRSKNRNSFHQNVEEALSSLLWQPYEYQNSASLSSSSCSSHCSSFCDLDEEETTKNDDDDDGTSSLREHQEEQQQQQRSCSFTDLHLPISTTTPASAASTSRSTSTSTEMVINLPYNEMVAGQSQRRMSSSRDSPPHTIRSTTWLSFSSGSQPAVSVLDTLETTVVKGTSMLVSCDASDVNSGDIMQVNVSTGCSAASAAPQPSIVNVNSTTSAENGLRNSAAAPVVPSSSSAQTSNNIFANNLNLSSANVVGLPKHHHARYASVPCSILQQQQTRPSSGGNNNTIFPNHSRHISEPSSQFMKYNNGLTAQQQNNTVVPNHRHSSQMDHSNNLHQISHFRSSSVPKSVPLLPKHDTTTSTTTTTTVPSSSAVHVVNNARFTPQKSTPQQHFNANVSNVNVNFYRAVPVNVVSSVPTIHCLNTLQGGNNVSNVQVLPLGAANFQSQSATTAPINNSTSNNTSYVSGTTQVILHNAPANTTNSIQIPSSMNRSNACLDPHVIQVPAGSRGTISNYNNGTISNFLPPPPVTTLSNNVVIQNTRPINVNSTMVPTPPGASTTSAARTYTNTAINTVQVGTSSGPPSSNRSSHEVVRTQRTFTSTEAQTDDISVLPPVNNEASVVNREQRRRERREKRHQRRGGGGGAPAIHRHSVESSTQVNNLPSDRLPDLLNSHLPPPYTTLTNGGNQPPPPQSVIGPVPPQVPPPPMVPPPHMLPPPPPGTVLQTVVPNSIVPHNGFVFPAPPPGQVPMVQGPTPVAVPVPSPGGFRFPFPATGFRRGRYTEEPPKGCCGLLSWKPGSLRWFIALIALVAVCCVLVGTALGAMRPAGRDHLTISLLMIGVGIVLVTVSGVAWRLTSHDTSACRSMLGLGSSESVDACTRRFVPRLPPSYGRPHHPYAAMMYPEFQYRPPPPSYQASMQEYRLRLLLLDRGNTPQIQAGVRDAVSPPPTYRSHAGSLLRAPLSNRREAAQSEYSCPPSYRSQNSTVHRPGTLQSNSVLHSREHSLSLSDSNHADSLVNVVNILGSTEEDIALDNITLDSLKMEPESDINPVKKMLLKGSSHELDGSKDGNLVTIVQTSDQSPVIVTVSGSSHIDNNNSSSVQITEIPSEMEILAHL